MDEHELSAFAYVALFLADRGDGALADDELRAIVFAVLEAGAGVEPQRARNIALQASQRFYEDRGRLDNAGLADGVIRRVDALARHGASLAQAYRELVQIAAADGATAPAEAKILGIIRSRWKLD